MEDFKSNATLHVSDKGSKSFDYQAQVIYGQFDTTVIIQHPHEFEKFVGTWDGNQGCLKLSDGKGETLFLVRDPTSQSNWIGRWETTDNWGMVCIEFDYHSY